MKFEQCVNLLEHQSELRLDRIEESRQAWTRKDISAEDWELPIPPAALAEIGQVVKALRREALPTYLLSPEFFEMPACREMMSNVKGRLTEGRGFVLLEGFPLDDLSHDEAKAVYWLLGRMLSQPVAGRVDGTVLYDIRDYGNPYGIGVRGSLTNTELEFHTDNTFAHAPPDYISLLCVRPALEGGVSRIASFCTLHNELLRNYPRQLQRLYEPYYYDRSAEHPDDEPKVSISRAFNYNGSYLRGRLSYKVMMQGCELMGEEMDSEGRDALDTAYGVINDPGNWIEHTLQRGQIQFVNNRAVAHARSGFVDDKDPALARHLVRLWYREEGRPFFNG